MNSHFHVKIAFPRVNEFRIHPVFYSSIVKRFPILINFKSWLESFFRQTIIAYIVFFLNIRTRDVNGMGRAPSHPTFFDPISVPSRCPTNSRPGPIPSHEPRSHPIPSHPIKIIILLSQWDGMGSVPSQVVPSHLHP